MPDPSVVDDLRVLAQKNYAGLARFLVTFALLLLKVATWVMEAEFRAVCGVRGKHKTTGFQRWGTNSRSIRIGLERLSICVPRVRNVLTDQAYSLEDVPSYEQAGLIDKARVTQGFAEWSVTAQLQTGGAGLPSALQEPARMIYPLKHKLR